MFELSQSQFLSTQPLFCSTHYGVLAAGTLEGGHPGRVFIDDTAHPRSGLICTRAGYYFLAGEPTPAFVESLPGLFTGDLLLRQKAELGSAEVILFFDPPGWQEALFAGLASFRPVRIRKPRHILPPGGPISSRAAGRLPYGMRFVPFSAGLLQSRSELAGACWTGIL